MLPNELQLNILSVLDQPRSEEDDSLTCSDMVAERLNLDLHIVEYHFGILDQEGLVKVLVDQECMGDEPRIYCVQLTPKGKVALRSPDQLVAIEQRAAHTVINQNNDFR